MGMGRESHQVLIQFLTTNSWLMNDPVAPLSIRAHVWNLAPMSVVFNLTWRSRELVKSDGELIMMKHWGTWQFSQVGYGGYAFGVVSSYAVGGGDTSSIH